MKHASQYRWRDTQPSESKNGEAGVHAFGPPRLPMVACHFPSRATAASSSRARSASVPGSRATRATTRASSSAPSSFSVQRVVQRSTGLAVSAACAALRTTVPSLDKLGVIGSSPISPINAVFSGPQRFEVVRVRGLNLGRARGDGKAVESLGDFVPLPTTTGRLSRSGKAARDLRKLKQEPRTRDTPSAGASSSGASA